MIVIAHRANGFGFPENSVEAICACVDAGFIPEADVRSRDGQAVLSHDAPEADAPTCRELFAALKRLKLRRPARLLLHVKESDEMPYIPACDDGWIAPFTFARRDLPADFLQVESEDELCNDYDGVVAKDDAEWLNAEIVAGLHADGLAVLVAGRNVFRRNERRWAELYAMGVEGVLTNEPRALRRFIEETA